MEKELYNEIISKAKNRWVESQYQYGSGYYTNFAVVFYNPDTKRNEVVHSAYNLDEFKKTKQGKPLEPVVEFTNQSGKHHVNFRHIGRYYGYYRDESVECLNSSLKAFKKDFPYSGIESFSSICNVDIKIFLYTSMYMENPELEKIVKVHPQWVGEGIDETEMLNRCIKKGKKTMKEICQMPDWLWKKLVKEEVNLKTWNFIRIWYKQSEKDGDPLVEEDINSLIQLGSGRGDKTMNSFKYIIKNAVDENGKKLFTITKLNKYLDRIDMYQAIDRVTGIEILRDYINMCKDLNIVPVTDSNSLKREHDVTARVHLDYARRKWDEKRAEQMKEQEERFKNVYPELEKFTFENDELQVVVPHSPKDMLDEARMNHNCLSSYIENFASGLSKIFFIRRKDEPEKSYITMELNSTLCDYRQAYYACNQPVTKKSDLSFIKKWLENNKKLRLENA